MAGLSKGRRAALILQETTTDLQEVEQDNLHSYNEYLIEIIKVPHKERYLPRIYKFVAAGLTCNSTQTALKKAADFLESFRWKGTLKP